MDWIAADDGTMPGHIRSVLSLVAELKLQHFPPNLNRGGWGIPEPLRRASLLALIRLWGEQRSGDCSIVMT
jgi:hypothetical protein